MDSGGYFLALRRSLLANLKFWTPKALAVITAAVPPDEEKLEKWEIKAEKACGALKTAISHELRVPIR